MEEWEAEKYGQRGSDRLSEEFREEERLVAGEECRLVDSIVVLMGDFCEFGSRKPRSPFDGF